MDGMDKKLYLMLMDDGKPLNLDVIHRHVEHLKRLDMAGKLFICGPFTNYHGGMVIFHAESYEEALEIAQSDPFIAEGYKTFQVRVIEVAEKENGYLMN